MKRAILRAFHLVVRTKVQKSPPRIELFSGIKMNSLENLAMNITINYYSKSSENLALNSTINCTILGAIEVPEPYSLDVTNSKNN